MSDRMLGAGIGVFKTEEDVRGTVHYVRNPSEVIELTNRDLDSVIGMVRAGTSAFASPLLANDVGGLITMQGAPTSHLGILSREYHIPCVMSLEPTEEDVIEAEADTEEFFAEWGEYLDGREVRLDLSTQDGAMVQGQVFEVGGGDP